MSEHRDTGTIRRLKSDELKPEERVELRAMLDEAFLGGAEPVLVVPQGVVGVEADQADRHGVTGGWHSGSCRS